MINYVNYSIPFHALYPSSSSIAFLFSCCWVPEFQQIIFLLPCFRSGFVYLFFFCPVRLLLMLPVICCYIHLFFNYSLKLTADQRVVSVVWLQQEKKTRRTQQHQKLIMTRVRSERPIFQKTAIVPCRSTLQRHSIIRGYTNGVIYLVYM